MTGSLFPNMPTVRAQMTDEQVTALAKQAECYETDPWAAEAILRHELLTHLVWDPCCGTGILSEAARAAHYQVMSTDLHDWGYEPAKSGEDFLTFPTRPHRETTIFMNPPFSLACEFVDKAHGLGARKIVCFQRFAWWESEKRREWWAKRPPNRIYICGDRAECWRFDIPHEERTGSTPTAHGWFIWERGQPPGPTLGHIWKRDAARKDTPAENYDAYIDLKRAQVEGGDG